MVKLFRNSLPQLALGLFAFGCLGLLAELVLLEHTESTEQWIPLALLPLGLLAAAMLARRREPGQVRSFRILMALFVVTGMLGLYYHFVGNVEFALERDPALTELALAWKALGGATPTLAPGALVQLGLLGLLATLPERLTERARTPDGDSLD